MPLTVEQLEAEALELPSAARARLVRRLAESLKRPKDEASGNETPSTHPVELLRGLLGSGQNTDELIEAMRGR